MQEQAYSEKDACAQVGGLEFPKLCGPCNPLRDSNDDPVPPPPLCPPCGEEECSDHQLGRCPRFSRTYICTEGSSFGGCSGEPWDLIPSVCSSCCERTDCPEQPTVKVAHLNIPADEKNCPPCTEGVCSSPRTLCPLNGAAPYLCVDGDSAGGCSPTPWTLNNVCRACCNVVTGCAK